jgi:hypothetical protein
MIGPIEKGATLSDLYAQGLGKFQGVAEELANSTSGRFAAAQEAFNEQMDAFGAQFLPIVSEALTFLVEKGLPAFQGLLDTVAPIITDLVDNYVRPLADSVGELFAEFDRADFSPLELALAPIKLALDGIKIVIDLIVAGIRLLNDIGDFGDKLPKGPAYSPSYGPQPPMNSGGGGGGYKTSFGQITTNLVLDGEVIATNTNKRLGGTTNLTNGGRTNTRP